MLNRLQPIARQARKFSTTLTRYAAGHGRPGIPGQNFPLNLDMGKHKLTLTFMGFFGIATSAPWLVIWWLFHKN